MKELTILALVSFLVTVGCASSAPESVLQVGSRNLKCPRSEVSTELHRTTPVVREYLVGCDFMYTRVHCTDTACRPAEIKPPCIGEGPCFEEDPVTLEWRLPTVATVAAKAQPR